jgi:hypothetical protein
VDFRFLLREQRSRPTLPDETSDGSGGGGCDPFEYTDDARDHGGRRAARGRTRGAHTVVTPLYILLNVRGFNYIYDFALRLRPRNAHLTKVEKRTDTAAQPRPRAVPDPLIMSLSCWDLGLPPRPRPARAHDTTRLELHRCTTHTLVCDLCVVVVSLSHCDLCIRTDTALLCMRSL